MNRETFLDLISANCLEFPNMLQIYVCLCMCDARYSTKKQATHVPSLVRIGSNFMPNSGLMLYEMSCLSIIYSPCKCVCSKTYIYFHILLPFSIKLGLRIKFFNVSLQLVKNNLNITETTNIYF